MFNLAIKRARTETDHLALLKDNVAFKMAEHYFDECTKLTHHLTLPEDDQDVFVNTLLLENANDLLEEYADVVVHLPEFTSTVTYIHVLGKDLLPSPFIKWLMAHSMRFNEITEPVEEKEDSGDDDENIQ